MNNVVNKPAHERVLLWLFAYKNTNYKKYHEYKRLALNASSWI